jgi:hypothetical protein
MVGMASKMAEKYSADLSIAVQKGMKRRTRDGKPTGGPKPLGLRYGADGFEIDSSEAPTILRIFRELHAGRPQLTIAQQLEADGVPTATGAKWHQGTIARIARNPIYKGMIPHNGELLPGTHQALVPPELWDEVNALLDSKAKSKAGKGRGRPPKGKHLFRKGMLKCVCGASMVPRTDDRSRRDKSDPYEIYACYGRHQHPDSCSVAPVNRAAIDSAVYSYFEQVGLDVQATREQVAAARSQKLDEVKALHAQAEVEKQRAEERLSRVRRDYMDDRISADDWASFRDELTTDLEGAAAEVSRLAEQRVEVEAFDVLQDIEVETLEALVEIRKSIAGEVNDAKGVDAARAALLRLFDGFALKEIKPGMRVHAELAWQGRYIIEPIVAERAVDGETPLRPVFRRQPLYDAETINRWGSPSSTASCAPASAPSCGGAPIPRTSRAGSASW